MFQQPHLGAVVTPGSSPASLSWSSSTGSLAAFCLMARLHGVAADPELVAHQLGWASSHQPTAADLMRAAKHLGLKSKTTRTTPARLPLTPLPALAFLEDRAGITRAVVLAQCDGQRVLFQDPSGAIQSGRPVIEPLSVFLTQWTGELLLVTSRASLAGDLAQVRLLLVRSEHRQIPEAAR